MSRQQRNLDTDGLAASGIVPGVDNRPKVYRFAARHPKTWRRDGRRIIFDVEAIEREVLRATGSEGEGAQ